MVTNTSRFEPELFEVDFTPCIVLSIWFKKGFNTCAYEKVNFLGEFNFRVIIFIWYSSDLVKL